MNWSFSFRPKLVDTLKNYSAGTFFPDLMAGLTVGIVALTLAMAFAIASGVKPEAGIFTAVIAGFLISALGGTKVSIGGPTGALERPTKSCKRPRRQVAHCRETCQSLLLPMATENPTHEAPRQKNTIEHRHLDGRLLTEPGGFAMKRPLARKPKFKWRARPPRAQFFAPSRKTSDVPAKSFACGQVHAPKGWTRGASSHARGGRVPRLQISVLVANKI